MKSQMYTPAFFAALFLTGTVNGFTQNLLTGLFAGLAVICLVEAIYQAVRLVMMEAKK